MSALFQTLETRLKTARSGNAKRAVEELAAHVLGCKPLEIYFREISPEQQAELEELIVRAERGEPIQYIIGHVDFRGLEIRCDRRALIPRPETELLVEEVLKSKTQSLKPLRIADVGTGTGCIALALLAELPDAEVIGVDISPDALALARENAERLGLTDRFVTVQGNLLNVDATPSSRSKNGKRDESVASAFFTEASFDIVVSNPPYIFSKVLKNLEPCVRDFEPQLALDGGEDGLDLIRPLVEQAARALKSGGGLFLEIGYDQGPAIFQCLENAGFQHVKIQKDFAGLDRIVSGKI
ncbi:MAG: peptide chain release factor N(5)-glutamine methyltransferase [Kiritimatiellales bacterium]